MVWTSHSSPIFALKHNNFSSAGRPYGKNKQALRRNSSVINLMCGFESPLIFFSSSVIFVVKGDQF